MNHHSLFKWLCHVSHEIKMTFELEFLSLQAILHLILTSIKYMAGNLILLILLVLRWCLSTLPRLAWDSLHSPVSASNSGPDLVSHFIYWFINFYFIMWICCVCEHAYVQAHCTCIYRRETSLWESVLFFHKTQTWCQAPLSTEISGWPLVIHLKSQDCETFNFKEEPKAASPEAAVDN